MTSDIGHIKAMFNASTLPVERLPSRDFAHELAKRADGRVAKETPRQVDSTAAGGVSAQASSDVAGNVPARISPASAGGVTAQIAPGAAGGLSAQLDSGSAQPGHRVTSVPIPHVAGIAQDAKSSSAQNTGFTMSAVMHEQLGRVVQPTGNTEALLGSRVFGVHLLASTYLSELTARAYPDPAAVPDVMLPEMANMRPQTHALPSDIPPVTNDAVADRSFHEAALAALSMLAKSEEMAVAGHSTASDATSVDSAMAVTTLWPESSLRLTRQRDGSAVIWLRDYRVPHEAAARLVDVLMKGAMAEGIRLGRIVLNGREVWTSHHKSY
ncbi:MAG: hypothetical protein KGJ32_01195 [Xanthomonadaceae bacterium]|nr:hypothetical protein [Xanthomonadaceae bacterium]